MKSHPYTGLPSYCYWKRAVTNTPLAETDLVVEAPFKIGRQEAVVTAGSCFAQHIARYLRNSGFGFLITEKPHPFVSHPMAEEFGYGVYTARYGNIYTTRQLLQLFQRAYGLFTPQEDIWRSMDNTAFVDPFRPQIQPVGFCSEQDYYLDRETHFRAVREAFEKMEVFVFTLGLTESWINKTDGAVYPLCPGVAGGEFSDNYEFVNFEVDEVVADFKAFLRLLREKNPTCKIILTVSPVPLMATYEKRHVVVSTTYSKSVLRVACEKLVKTESQVAYFPSYEIITGNQSRGQFFGPDLRSVKEDGVKQVMHLFFKHYLNELSVIEKKAEVKDDQFLADMTQIIKTMCDEEALGKNSEGQ